jgi:3-hydroxyacyl-CoA dehydrogenase
LFKLPEFVNKMMENKWLGSKQIKVSTKKEGKDILTLDLDTLEYRAARASFATLELTKTIDKPINRFKVLVKGKDKAGEFYRKVFWNVCLCFEPYS